MRPVERPAASSAATARNDVVVLPSVPVIPTTPIRRDASPCHHPAACASAVRDALTMTCGSDVPETACSTMAAAAPASAARPTDSVPGFHVDGHEYVDVEARDRGEQRPLPHEARILGHA